MQLNGPHTDHEHASVSLKVLLLIFGVLLAVTLGYMVWDQNTASDATDNSAPKVKEEATTETTTTADETADWKTYTNSDYGFTLTFGELWKGYKVKSSTIDSASTITYHFTMPYSGYEASEINDKGYYPVLSVNIFTKDEYNKVENKGLLLGSNNSYVFTYGGAQDNVKALEALQADVANVASTFKLTK